MHEESRHQPWTHMRHSTHQMSVIALVLLSACARPTEAHGVHAGTQALFAPRATSGVEIRTLVSRDTVKPGDGPIEIAYVVVNGPGPQQFINSPDLFNVIVEHADGRRAKMEPANAYTSSWGDMTHLTLPGEAMLVQYADLRCVNRGAYAAKPSRGVCEYGYPLREPGEYRVIVEYIGGPDIQADPAADTARLVVR